MIKMPGCRVCGGKLHLVPADEPWHADYYVCEECDSTFNIGDIMRKKTLDDGAQVPEEKKEEKKGPNVQEMIKNFASIIPSIIFQAMLTRSKYDALVAQGFSREEALELCKEWKK